MRYMVKKLVRDFWRHWRDQVRDFRAAAPDAASS
jgi:hypothetical protein